MKPEHRRAMLLALVDLYGSALPEDAPERETLADQWDDVNAHVSGAKVNEDRLAPMVITTMTWAAGAIRRSVARYGPDGPVTTLFAQQAAQLDHIVNARSRKRKEQGAATRQAVLAAQAAGLSKAETAQKLRVSESTVAKHRRAGKRG